MIPAKTQCPTNWTTEYVGYLMSGVKSHPLPTEYQCVDKNPESVMVLDGVQVQQYSIMSKPPAMEWPVLHMKLRKS